MLKTVEINVPEELVQYTVVAEQTALEKRNAMLIYPYVQNGTISNGKAAEILGMSKIELISLYGEMGIPYFDETAKELDEDLANIKDVRGGFAC